MVPQSDWSQLVSLASAGAPASSLCEHGFARRRPTRISRRAKNHEKSSCWRGTRSQDSHVSLARCLGAAVLVIGRPGGPCRNPVGQGDDAQLMIRHRWQLGWSGALQEPPDPVQMAARGVYKKRRVKKKQTILSGRQKIVYIRNSIYYKTKFYAMVQ